MKINYIISIILLLLSFLLFPKSKKKTNIINSIIYTICLFYCYQTTIVYLLSFLNKGGNLINYSIINYLISIIFIFITIKNKKIQKYYLPKKELLLTSLVIITIFLVVFYRFRGFTSISYISDDASIHYRASKTFKDTLAIITENNNKDLIYGFEKMMPMYYINCGFFLKLISNIPSYKAFIIHDSICLILYSLLFLITIQKITKQSNIYTYIATILYTLAYPLNNLIFGFSYLGLGIMTINLILYTILHIKEDFTTNKILKLIILFSLNFSLFNSYYLFMPFTYLSQGIYYIYLWKKKKITTKDTLLYGIITLILPFIIGFIYFILPGLFNSKTNIITAITLNGDIYKNIAPLYLYLFTTAYIIYDKFKNKTKTNFFLLTLYILSVYILIFLILYILKIAATYYFYKLFYIYWLFFSIYIINKLIKKKIIIYIAFIFIIISINIVINSPYSSLSRILEKTTIYTYNARKFNNDWIRLTKEELDLIDSSIKYKDICEQEHKLPIIGQGKKNAWFYAITGSIPNINYKKRNREELYAPNISLDNWKETNYKCIVYFYENNTPKKIDEYKILYQNNKGALISKNINN